MHDLCHFSVIRGYPRVKTLRTVSDPTYSGRIGPLSVSVEYDVGSDWHITVSVKNYPTLGYPRVNRTVSRKPVKEVIGSEYWRRVETRLLPAIIDKMEGQHRAFQLLEGASLQRPYPLTLQA